MDAIKAFQKIVGEAIAAEKADPYGWDLISFGSALIDIARQNPGCKSDFVDEFNAMIVADDFGPGGPFVEFCMHALRWDEVRNFIEELHIAAISKPDWRAEPYYRHLSEAFEDEWDDANDIYASYFRRGI